jgi:uncharacterized membrane protein
MAPLAATPAAADFRICNLTKGRVGIALGYKDGEGWATEGWWNVVAGNCETLLRGNLAARFYYVYAVDYDRGGEWSGQAFMCTRDKEFTIRGTGDCLARGYDRDGFFEVDTGEQQTWTVQLTEAGEAARQQGAGKAPSPARRAVVAVAAFNRKSCAMRRRRTKIVATLGPASSDRAAIAALFTRAPMCSAST